MYADDLSSVSSVCAGTAGAELRVCGLATGGSAVVGAEVKERMQGCFAWGSRGCTVWDGGREMEMEMCLSVPCLCCRVVMVM